MKVPAVLAMALASSVFLGCPSSSVECVRDEDCGDAAKICGDNNTCEPVPADEGEGEDEACVATQTGRWVANGPCQGMRMECTLSLDDAGCTMAFTAWNMAMSEPTGATVAGADVTFTGQGWTDCTGTLNDEGTHIDASCSLDGCTMTWDYLE